MIDATCGETMEEAAAICLCGRMLNDTGARSFLSSGNSDNSGRLRLVGCGVSAVWGLVAVVGRLLGGCRSFLVDFSGWFAS